MRTRIVPVLTVAFAVLSLCGFLAAQKPLSPSQDGKPWTLPDGLTVKDNGPRTYRFTVDYTTGDTKGQVTRRQRLVGEYTRGLPSGDVLWKNVTEADADGATAPYGAAEKREFMEGFRYPNDLAATLKPGFFKGFPPAAVFERNLVWDTGMIETFGQNYFEKLKLNEPYHMASNEDLIMPEVGKFQNRDAMLELVGRTQKNGQDCALINYEAFFNPLELANGGVNLKGRSHYWGQIWVSLATKQIEYGTLREDVMGELKLAGQDTTQIISVFRSGVFEPVNSMLVNTKPVSTK
jgi:hypothetical protein